MATTLSQASLNQHNERVQILRAKHIEDCNYLLHQLKKGIYYIPWEGVLPTRRNQRKFNTQNKLKIVVDSNVEYGRFFYLRKPYLTKTIKIGGRDASWIRTWQAEQLEELDHKLTQLITSELEGSA